MVGLLSQFVLELKIPHVPESLQPDGAFPPRQGVVKTAQAESNHLRRPCVHGGSGWWVEKITTASV